MRALPRSPLRNRTTEPAVIARHRGPSDEVRSRRTRDIALYVGGKWVPAVPRPCPTALPISPRFFVTFVPSWWKIADVTQDTMPVRDHQAGQALTCQGPGIFHRGGTKFAKTLSRASVAAEYHPAPTQIVIRARLLRPIRLSVVAFIHLRQVRHDPAPRDAVSSRRASRHGMKVRSFDSPRGFTTRVACSTNVLLYPIAPWQVICRLPPPALEKHAANH